MNVLSTPKRYMDIAFHCFDVSADGLVEAKVRTMFILPKWYNKMFKITFLFLQKKVNQQSQFLGFQEINRIVS